MIAEPKVKPRYISKAPEAETGALLVISHVPLWQMYGGVVELDVFDLDLN
jgi:hypothetical protein